MNLDVRVDGGITSPRNGQIDLIMFSQTACLQYVLHKIVSDTALCESYTLHTGLPFEPSGNPATPLFGPMMSAGGCSKRGTKPFTKAVFQATEGSEDEAASASVPLHNKLLC